VATQSHAVAATGTPIPSTQVLGASIVAPEDRPDPLLGQTLAGRYYIQRKLGEGGMGAVYLASHNVLEKALALKVLHGELARKPDLVERFIQEAKSASRIRHENVIDISDFGSTPEGTVFFAMELLTGHDLHEEVARARLDGQRLPWERSKRIFLQVCSALSAAHALGIIHRDLKPENIYLIERLGEPDFVKLLDFGIAKQTEVAEGDRKLTRTGMLFGTPEYMSPEQARGDNVDARVDVYAMGCILFQLVTGRVPFEAENFMGVLSLHLTEPPPAISPESLDMIGAPRVLAQVIERALAKDRNQRYSSIDELARAVRSASGDPASVPPHAGNTVIGAGAARISGQVPVAHGTRPGTSPSGTSPGRIKTEWTGNLRVPESDTGTAPPQTGRSRLPIILGALIVAGGAIAAVVIVSSHSGGAGGGSALVTPGSGSMIVQQTQLVQPPAAQPPPAVQPPPAQAAPFTFETSMIQLDSIPSGAEVIDPAVGRIIGHTPLKLKVRASHNARQFELHARNFLDTTVELVPEHETVVHVEKLERGSGHKAASAPVARPAVSGTGGAVTTPAADDGPTLKPEVPATQEVKPVEVKPVEVKPAAEVKPAKPAAPADDDVPTLKADPSRPQPTP
jgi:serine/threonine-protein kinase